jgi:glycosyltransferase involved in cell wall biosynthesis
MKELGLNTKQTTVIPHGNYINVYADDISVSAAHRKLHVKKNERVILFFGLIRRYKGVEDLIAAFKKADHKNVRLIIAGKCTDASLKQEIIAAQKQYPIDFHDGYVADDQVAAYFKAADVVCLPFKATTTSGSALLALSFGRALIAPRTGALKDVPSTVGYFYDPAKSNDLGQAIQTALIDPGQLERKGNNAHEYALTLDWDKIARKTIKVYEQTSKKVQ